MIRVLLKKNLDDARWLALGCALTMFAFSWVRVWLVSRIEMARFQAFLDLLPADFKRFLPVDAEWLVTYPGRIAMTFEEPIIFFGVCLWSIARGSDVVSGELGRGTMEILLAQPIRRWQLILANGLVTMTGTLLLCCAAWAGIYLGLQTHSVTEEVRPTWQAPFDLPWLGGEFPVPFAKPTARRVPLRELVDPVVFAPATFNLGAAGLLLAGFTSLVSAADRWRWRTIGIVAGFLTIQIILKVVTLTDPSLAWMRYTSLLCAYEPERLAQLVDFDPAAHWKLALQFQGQNVWGPVAYYLILAVPGSLCYLAAAWVFERRDLPAPS